jgi:hypothetical protein
MHCGPVGLLDVEGPMFCRQSHHRRRLGCQPQLVPPLLGSPTLSDEEPNPSYRIVGVSLAACAFRPASVREMHQTAMGDVITLPYN